MTDSFPLPFRTPSPARSGADTVVLGERTELNAIREHAEHLAQGQGALVMWFGPRGAGKTRLLHQASSLVTEVVPHVRTVHVPGDTLQDSTMAGVSAMLVHALDLPPSADSRLVDETLMRGEKRRISDPELMRAAANIGRQATATRPILVLIDDLPYFAVEDISALAILAARIAEFPLLIVCTSSYPLPPEKSLSAFGPLWMRRINPVSPAGAWNIGKTYGAGFIPPSLAARISELGGGLPGDIVEIVRDLSPAELRGEVAMPAIVNLSRTTLADIRSWLGDLDEKERLLVVAAALDPFGNRDDLEDAFGVDMESAGRNAEDRWFTADRAHYVFTEPRRRAGVLAVATRREVLAAHRAMAAHAADGTPSRAWNLLRAGQMLQDEELDALAEAAARELDTGDLELSYSLAREALTVARSPELRARLSFVVGIAAMHLGHVETAYEELTTVISSTEDDEMLAKAVSALVLTVSARDGSVPITVLDAAIERLSPTSPQLAVSLAAIGARVCARVSMTAADVTSKEAVWETDLEYYDLAQRYLQVAEELGHEVDDVEAATALEFAHAYVQDRDTVDVQLLTTPLSGEYHRSDITHWSRLLSKVEILCGRADVDQAQLAIADTRARLMRTSSPLFAARMIVAEMRMHLSLGHVQRAVGIARDAMYELPLHLVGPGLGVVVTAEVFTYAGLRDLADQWTSASRLAAHHFTTPHLRARVPALLGLRASLDGDLHAAAEFMAAAAQHATELGAPVWHAAFLEDMQHQFLIGNDQTTSPVPARIQALLDNLEHPGEEQTAALALAQALSCPAEEVVATVQRLHEAATSLSSPLSRARCLLLAVRALRRVDAEAHAAQAREIPGSPPPEAKADHVALLVSEAATAAGEAGAQALIPVIRRAAPSTSSATTAPATAGRPVRSNVPASSGPSGEDASEDALTPEERSVAQMVVAGASNKQVAAALYVSVRTVELRLTSIYRKLGISSRKELPRALATRESTPAFRAHLDVRRDPRP